MPAALLTLLAAAGVSLAPASEIRLATPTLRVGDAADLGNLPAQVRDAVSKRIVAVLPAGRNAVTLSRTALAALVRRAAPALDVSPGGDGPVTVFAPLAGRAREADANAGAGAGGCYATSHPVARGTLLTTADLAITPCQAQGQAAPLAFDREQNGARAGADLAEGSYFGRIAPVHVVQVARGAAMTLVSSVGPVRIERRVVALQAGRAGGRIFVRDQDGLVLAAALAPDLVGEARQ